MTVDEQFESGLSLHQGGRLSEAGKIYRQVLVQQPDYADAIYMLGVLAEQAGQLEAALNYFERAIAACSSNSLYHSSRGNVLLRLNQSDESIAALRQAIRLDPEIAELHSTLAYVLMTTGRLDEAIDSFRHATRINPDIAEVHCNLGIALKNAAQLDQAIGAFRRATQLKPSLAEAYNNLGATLRDRGQLEEAIAACRQAIQINPEYAEAYGNLGNALKDIGQLDDAVAACRKAIRIRPDDAEAYCNLGNALKEIRLFDEAIASFRRALQLQPGLAGGHYNLGHALDESGQLDEAIASCRQAINLKADFHQAYLVLGKALRSVGRLDEAIAAAREAIRLKPEYADAHSFLVYALIFHPAYDAPMIQQELNRWNQRHAEPLMRFIEPYVNDRNPNRRLRIGYVSADFRDHVVGRNLVPLLREHDHEQFEIFCYSDVRQPDAITGQFREYSDEWRDIARQSHASACDLIRQDRIDVLIDLTLHMANNRLGIFARKPAPVQATFAGYPGSTGLNAIEYRLTDPFLDPPGSSDRFYAERSIHLPDSFWCFDPLNISVSIGPLPEQTNGHITFGCFNNFCKINQLVLQLWAQVLKHVDRSRLMILCPEGHHRQTVLDILGKEGINPDRIEMVTLRPRPSYLELYRSIDIGLDTFPYNGHTTSMDSYWMGVPVVTLVGQTVVGRAGLSLLRNLGMPELIAHKPEDYVRIAVGLAKNIPRLAEMRRTLRGRMETSPLMNAPRFARNIEAALHQMWRNWCEDVSSQ